MSKRVTIFVGTYTNRQEPAASRSEGIYVFELALDTGALARTGVVPGVVNPSFLALHPAQGFLYSVNEVTETDGKPTGGVSAFAIEDGGTSLRFLNHQSSHGTAPCHLSVDKTGRYVLAANYTSGSIAAFPIRADGSLGEATAKIQHEGSSINPTRQQGPHAHSINLDSANRFAFVADLGLDKVMVYKLDLNTGSLLPNDPPSVSVTPGVGPRHFAFHPARPYAYLINEIGSTITAFAYDAEHGALRELQTVPTLPAGFEGRSSCADIHVLPNGRFVYGSNRGHDSIVIYAIDLQTGRLSLVGHESTRGRTPRNFAIDPTGSLLLAANQDTNNIVTYWIDQESGKLTPTGQSASAPAPVCIQFLA